jgi:UDP-N-acetylglucosamine--dolichyl-phosphate N-acetylglucosaminephosphotransferase
VGIIYLVIAIIFQQFHYAPDSIVCCDHQYFFYTYKLLCPEAYLTVAFAVFFLQWLVEYNAALASVCFMILLGFVDDVLDVPWRVYVACQTVFLFS